MQIIEAHAHYNLNPFSKNRKEIIMSLYEKGIERFVIPATGYESNFDMHNKFDEDQDYERKVYYAAGVHPKFVMKTVNHDAFGITPLAWDEKKDVSMRRFLAMDRTVAIGETGLDYSLPDMPDYIKTIQREYFERFIRYANEYKKPIILHIRPYGERDANGNVTQIDEQVFIDAEEIIRENPIRYGAVMHCFLSSADIAKRFMNLGVQYFGLGGGIGDRASKSLLDFVEWVGPDHILIETDAPYQKFRVNDPSPVTSETLFAVLEKLSAIKGISIDELAEITYKNANTFYGFDVEAR